jgi:hypothetical protein
MPKDRANDPKRRFVYGDMTQDDVNDFEKKINPGLSKGHPDWESFEEYAERKRPAPGAE